MTDGADRRVIFAAKNLAKNMERNLKKGLNMVHTR